MKKILFAILITLFFVNTVKSQTLNIPDNIGTSNNVGNIGIGTTSPSSKLSVRNVGGIDGVKLLDFSESNDEEFIFTGDFLSTGATGNKIILGSGVTGWQPNIMSWRGDGYVGINTTTPLEKLHIENGALQFLNIGADLDNVDIIKIGESSIANEFVLQGMFLGVGESGNAIKFRSSWNDNLIVMNGNGQIGIGISNPMAKLSVYGSTSEGWSSGIELNREGGGKGWIVVDNEGMKFRTPVDGDGFYFRDNSNNTTLIIKDGGQVGIGTTITGTHKLAVEGTIGAREIKVEATGWSDFVLDNNYKLKDLEEVESFIEDNNHLPDVPSEKEVLENGIQLGEMDATLLQKIEELMLYTIQQEKKIRELESLNTKLLEIQKRLEKLEKK